MPDSISVKNGRLVIDVALDTKGRDSDSGKTTVHHTSSGFKTIAGSEYRYSLNVIKAKTKA